MQVSLFLDIIQRNSTSVLLTDKGFYAVGKQQMTLNVKYRIFQHYTGYWGRTPRPDLCAQTGGVNDHLSSRFEIEDSSNELVQRSA